MNPRVLTILNTIGCIILAGWVVFHWFKERRMHENLTFIQSEFIRSEKLAASESERAAALERDIAVLKETIEMTQQRWSQTTQHMAIRPRRARRQNTQPERRAYFDPPTP